MFYQNSHVVWHSLNFDIHSQLYIQTNLSIPIFTPIVFPPQFQVVPPQFQGFLTQFQVVPPQPIAPSPII